MTTWRLEIYRNDKRRVFIQADSLTKIIQTLIRTVMPERKRKAEREAEMERLTPLGVAYDYLESPACADMLEDELARRLS